MTTHTMRLQHCPACGAELELATNVDGSSAGPAPGDVSHCETCSQLLIFREDLSVRVATEADVAGLDSETRATVDRVQVTLGLMKRSVRVRLYVIGVDTAESLPLSRSEREALMRGCDACCNAPPAGTALLHGQVFKTSLGSVTLVGAELGGKILLGLLEPEHAGEA